MCVTPLAFLCGIETFSFPCTSQRLYTSFLLNHRLAVTDVRIGAEGTLRVSMRTQTARDFRTALSSRGIPIPKTVGRRGLPYLLPKIAARPGLISGAILGIALVIASTLFCFRVDVICLDNAQAVRAEDYVDTDAVRARLAAQGVGVGTFLPTLDIRNAEKRFLIDNGAVSWIALNRRGTVLSAEVRSSHAYTDEHGEDPETTEQEGVLLGTNLIADADGLIVRWEVENGKVLVKHAQMVTKGTLLATGFYESKDGDIVYSRARGKVFAETERTFCVRVPYEVTEEYATGEMRRSVSISFFGRESPSVTAPNVTFLEIFQKWRKNTGFFDKKYDTIIDTYPITLFGRIVLPITAQRETRLYKTEVTRTREKDEMAAYANASIEAHIATMTDATVISRETDAVWDEEGLSVTVYIHCIDNIAVSDPYYFESK